MNARRLLAGLGGVVAIVGLAAVGYEAGSSSAPEVSDASRATRESYRTAYSAALADARDRSRSRAKADGLFRGRERGRRTGAEAGSRAGKTEADAQLAAAEVQQAAEMPAVVPPPGSTYSDQLPNGRPGYILPDGQRSISCIGVDAATGECVGD